MLERFDVLGGLMTAETTANGKVLMVVSETAPAGRKLHAAAHILESDDCVAVAAWLLRQAFTLGDPRPEVLAALGALQNLADREEAQAGG